MIKFFKIIMLIFISNNFHFWIEKFKNLTLKIKVWQYIKSNDRLTSLIDTMTSLFEYIDIILRIHWHPLIRSGKNLSACFHSGKQSCLSSSHLENSASSSHLFHSHLIFFTHISSSLQWCLLSLSKIVLSMILKIFFFIWINTLILKIMRSY